MVTPIGSEAPIRRGGVFGSKRTAISCIHRLNFVTTNPRLMTAMLVLTQAKNVRSLARYSTACLSSLMVACGDSLSPVALSFLLFIPVPTVPLSWGQATGGFSHQRESGHEDWIQLFNAADRRGKNT